MIHPSELPSGDATDKKYGPLFPGKVMSQDELSARHTDFNNQVDAAKKVKLPEPVVIDIVVLHRKPFSMVEATCGACKATMRVKTMHFNDAATQRSISDWAKLHFPCFGYPAPQVLLNADEVYDIKGMS